MFSKNELQKARRVTFVDPNGNVVHGEQSVSTGMVNGSLWLDDDDEPLYLPVWCERDCGREATTVQVHVSNILEINPDEKE